MSWNNKGGQVLTADQRKNIKVGDKIGGLSILSLPSRDKKIAGRYQCKCGRESTFWFFHIPHGCKHCLNRTHGHYRTKIYQAWTKMKMACLTPHARCYLGGNVSLYEPWIDFSEFLKDMGLPPSPTCRLKRIDPSGDFEPDNTEWREIRKKR